MLGWGPLSPPESQAALRAPLPPPLMFPWRSPFGTPSSSSLLRPDPHHPPPHTCPGPCGRLSPARIPGPLGREIMVRYLHTGFSGREVGSRVSCGCYPPLVVLGPLLQWRILSPRRGGRNPSPGVSCALECAVCKRERPSQGLVRSPGVSRGLP